MMDGGTREEPKKYGGRTTNRGRTKTGTLGMQNALDQLGRDDAGVPTLLLRAKLHRKNIVTARFGHNDVCF